MRKLYLSYSPIKDVNFDDSIRVFLLFFFFFFVCVCVFFFCFALSYFYMKRFWLFIGITLMKVVLMSTHSICFDLKITKLSSFYNSYR